MAQLQVDVVLLPGSASGNGGGLADRIRAAGYRCELHEGRVPHGRLCFLLGTASELDSVLHQVDARFVIPLRLDADAGTELLRAAEGTLDAFRAALDTRLAAKLREFAPVTGASLSSGLAIDDEIERLAAEGATQLPPESHLRAPPIAMVERAPEEKRIGKWLMMVVLVLAVLSVWDSISALFR